MTEAKISRREQILQTLMQMLQEQSLSRITTSALAREVGVSEAALYRHFASKAKIFEGLIDFIEDTLFARTKLIQQQELPALAQCQQMLTLLLTLVERNPGLCRLLTGEALLGEKERLGSRINQLFDKLETQLKQTLRDAELKAGERTADTPSTCANLLMAAAEGRIRQFSRSGFRHKPTHDWEDQWQLLSAQIMRP